MSERDFDPLAQFHHGQAKLPSNSSDEKPMRSMSSQPSDERDNSGDRFLSVLVGMFLSGCLLVITLGYQVVIWLYSGSWPHVSFLSLLLKIFPNTIERFFEALEGTWFLEPHSWYGLQKVASYAGWALYKIMDAPLALVFFLAIPVLMVLDTIIPGKPRRPAQTESDQR